VPFVLGFSNLCDGLPDLELLLILIGEGLWLIAYILIIRKGFQARSYGVPLTAIALNYTWELLYAFKWPSSCWALKWMRYGWLLFDSIIVLQLFLYGRKEQEIPDLRKNFVVCVIAIFLLAGVGHWTFHKTFDDSTGAQAAYIINFVMSILFVLTASTRLGAHGLSYGAAWLKMIGTAVLALVSALSFTYRPVQNEAFMFYLFVSIFFLDILYIYVLRNKLHHPLETPETPR
jgi:hypothetical protein